MNPKDRPPVLFTRWSSVFRGRDGPAAFAHRPRAHPRRHVGSVLPRIDDDPALAKVSKTIRAAVRDPAAAPTVTIIDPPEGPRS
jgi:hypothetical protein